MIRRITLIAMTLAVLACLAAPAYGWHETTDTESMDFDETNCGPCHQPYPDAVFDGVAVHGGYTTTSKKCDKCHDVHAAQNANLLPAATVQGACLTCHDGTAGKGVYGAITARGLGVPGARHNCDTTDTVPGGDPSSGAESTMTFGGLSGRLSCDDCHTPHASSVVATFSGERHRSQYAGTTYYTTHLLKQRPANSASSTAVYGSDWCGACHKGRLSGASVHNHPVDSVLTTTVPFNYGNVARLTADTPTSSTTMGGLGGSNRGYLMPSPRTANQAGHNPICQQCHEDSRFVGTLDPSGAPADAATFTFTTPDGNTASDNPRFQNFPHETVNTRFLVEKNDDLCTNCHAAGQLP